MATTISVAGGKTTLIIMYSADSTVMNTTLDGIAKALYEQQVRHPQINPLPGYETLTVGQRLGLIDAYVKEALIILHRQRLVKIAEQAAMLAAQIEGSVILE
jgi:hypothetical protein